MAEQTEENSVPGGGNTVRGGNGVYRLRRWQHTGGTCGGNPGSTADPVLTGSGDRQYGDQVPQGRTD